MMQTTEELYKDITDTWRFIRNHPKPDTYEGWEALVRALPEENANDDTKLKFHLMIGYMNYLAKMEEIEKNEKR